jgi:hypothetical protein
MYDPKVILLIRHFSCLMCGMFLRAAELKEIEAKIYLIRGFKVMLDADLAVLYGVETKYLNRVVKRNIKRFPLDFMFQLNESEAKFLRCQFVTSKNGQGGRQYNPYVFTQEGIAMLSGVLNSDRAIEANISIMRVFVGLRAMIADHRGLAEKLSRLEQKYDHQFKTIFDAIREIMSAHAVPRKRIIGFENKDE